MVVIADPIMDRFWSRNLLSRKNAGKIIDVDSRILIIFIIMYAKLVLLINAAIDKIKGYIGGYAFDGSKFTVYENFVMLWANFVYIYSSP